MSYEKPLLDIQKLVDLNIRQRALLIFICSRIGVPYKDYDDLDIRLMPEEVLEATKWAEGVIYGGVE